MLREWKFTAPDPRVQRKISSVLNQLDDKIEWNFRVAETLEAIARSLFKSWFVDFDPVRDKAEGRQTGLPDEVAALFPERFGEDGLPEGWREEPLLTHARLISGGTPKTNELSYWDGPIAWASAKDVSQCRDAFLLDTERTISSRGLAESATRLIPKFATVVVARGATTGRSCLLAREMAMNQTCYALSSLHGVDFWLNCAFRNLVDVLIHAAHGSVFDTITTRTIAGARVTSAHGTLRNRFEEVASPLFHRILENVREAMTLLSRLRDTLLPKLISGELRIADAEKRIAVA